MKLYTEEQVKILLNALTDIKNWNEELEDEWEDCGYRAIEAINEFADKEEIELPSNEEIEKTIIFKDIVATQGYCHCFIDGVNWMKEQILKSK